MLPLGTRRKIITCSVQRVKEFLRELTVLLNTPSIFRSNFTRRVKKIPKFLPLPYAEHYKIVKSKVDKIR